MRQTQLFTKSGMLVYYYLNKHMSENMTDSMMATQDVFFYSKTTVSTIFLHVVYIDTEKRRIP